MKKLIVAYTLALALIVSAFIYIPKYRFAQGHTYKVTAKHDIQSTENGGLALYLTVQDANGVTYEARTGFIAQWDIKEGHYINADKITLMGERR